MVPATAPQTELQPVSYTHLDVYKRQVITTICVCGIRFGWIQLVFPQNPTFWTIMTVYPVSLAATALAIFFALVYYRPARRFTAIQKNKTKSQPA